MYPICRLTEFNHALVYGFDPESSFNADTSFFTEIGQHIDLLNAYLYAQDHILPIIKKRSC